MTVDKKEKKIVLLVEGDEMKRKYEEKDFRLEELFWLAVEETPVPKETVMLSAKEFLRNKKVKNCKDAGEKKSTRGHSSMLRLVPALCALLLFGIFGGVSLVNRPKDQYAPLRFEEFSGLTNLRYSVLDGSCEESSEPLLKNEQPTCPMQSYLITDVNKQTVKFSSEKVDFVESRSYIPQNGSEVVLWATHYRTEYGDFILYEETGEYSLARFPEPGESIVVDGKSYSVCYGGEDVAYARFVEGDYRCCIVFPDNTLETVGQILALLQR